VLIVAKYVRAGMAKVMVGYGRQPIQENTRPASENLSPALPEF